MVKLVVRFKNPYGKGTNEKEVHIDNEEQLPDVIKDQKSSAKDCGIRITKMWLEDAEGKKIKEVK